MVTLVPLAGDGDDREAAPSAWAACSTVQASTSIEGAAPPIGGSERIAILSTGLYLEGVKMEGYVVS